MHVLERSRAPQLRTVDFGAGMLHVACCHDDDLGLCGADLRDEPWREDLVPGEQWCPVCYQLDQVDCSDTEYCGCLCCADELVSV